MAGSLDSYQVVMELYWRWDYGIAGKCSMYTGSSSVSKCFNHTCVY